MRLATLCTITLLSAALASSAAGPTFDAASVSLTGPEIQQPFTITGGPGTSDPGRFRAPRIQMINLLARAFGVSIDQITGPAWLRDVAASNNYTIVATMPPDTTKEQFEQMLQNMLAERFHLVFHHETRNFPGYELVVDKGGPKFKDVTPAPQDANPDAAAADLRTMMSAGRGADGFPNVPGSRVMGQGGRGGQQKTKYQERTMAQFISNLGFLIGSSQGKSVLQGYPQPRVADKTGLTGIYTFVLEYYDQSSADRRASLPTPASGATPEASEPDGGLPNIFAAIQKQLGLRLDKTADVPVDVIVVESVDKVPTEN